MKIAFMYSGQGAQYTGMGEELVEAYPEIQQYFDCASKVVGYDMAKLCFHDEVRIDETAFTQPAILTVSVAFTSLLAKQGIKADYLAGLSLGEYSALVEANALDFETAVKVVQQRGQFMTDAVKNSKGKMVAVMNTDRDIIEAACQKARTELNEYVAPANYNTPKQIVIGGTIEAVDLAMDHLREAGVRKMIPLQVSGPFHTALLKPASEQLATYLPTVKFETLQTPVVSNTTGESHNDEDLIQRLVEQVMQPVRWEDSVRYMIAQGVDTFIEIGPGKTLSKFMKQIDKSVAVHRVENVETLNETLTALKGDTND